MQNTKNILKTAGLLSVGTLAAFSQIASAAPRANREDVREERREVKEARKEVREERRDVKQADTKTERKEERREYKEAKKDLRQEERDLQRERAERARIEAARRARVNPTYGYSYGYNNRQTAPRYNNGSVYNNGTIYNRPTAPRYNYNYNTARSFRTLEGVVVNDFGNNTVAINTTTGQRITVQFQGREVRELSRGDRIRVYGYVTNGTFQAQNLSILRNR